MENKAAYFYVGVFVFGVLFAALFFAVWLGGFSHKEKFVYYQLLTNQSISGLGIKAPVRLLGVDVGSVEEAHIDTSKGRVGVRILLKLKEGTPITHSTYATIAGQGITGIKFIELATENEDAAILRQGDKNEIPTIPVKEGFLSTIGKQGDKFIELLDYTNERLRLLFSDKNIKNFNIILEKFANFDKKINAPLSNFSVASKKVANMADDYAGVKGSLSSTLQLLEVLLVQLNEVVGDLKQSPSDIFFKSGKNKLAPGE